MKSSARHTIQRAGAAVALGAALLSATGCGYFYKQPTTIHYAASDGVNTDVGSDVKVRNVMVIAKDQDSPGRLLGTVTNDSDQDLTLKVDTGDATADITVGADKTVHLETLEGSETPLLKKAGAKPGMTLEHTSFTAGNHSSTANVPVLDGTLEEYKDYMPNLSEQQSSQGSSGSASEKPSAGASSAGTDG